MSPKKSKPNAANCEWLGQREAFQRFATHTAGTESAKHIKPLHWYISCRLVLEGGFDPDHIIPRPPFRVESKKIKGKRGKFPFLLHDPSAAGGGEQVILGGLKTKNVDVVVTNPKLGPVLAISCKGITKSFRNLTNRMEETIGECTNLHITYPAMVIGYFSLLRANRTLQDVMDAPDLDDNQSSAEPGESDEPPPDAPSTTSKSKEETIKANDIAIVPTDCGEIAVESIVRFERALSEMTLRQGIRDEISRYEAMAIALIEPKGDIAGDVFPGYPQPGSRLYYKNFFQTLYQRYEERFVYGAPLLAERGVTKRYIWAEQSPAIRDRKLDFDPRTSGN